ncbi:MAG: phosphatase PAP2 family protein [Actinomycetota bacterium]|nr:phosphatase PAP2 family protein [Actinomycetota bacterium]
MRWALAAYVPAAIALAAARRRLGVPPAVTLPVISAAPLAAAAATPPGRWRYVAAGATYMWVFKTTWELPYDRPDRLRERLQVRYPIRLDSLIGGGVPPTLRLQRAWRDPPRVTLLDKAVTVVYGSWFVPHLVLGWLLLHHDDFVPRAGGRLAAAYHLTTPFYWLVPTAPPWWASEKEGEMSGEVERVAPQVLSALTGKPRKREGETKGNPWGSMPSDHIASAAITAMGLAEVSAVYGALGWTYVVLASFAVVYLGEHYVVDVIAGLAVAETVRRAEPAVNPLLRRIVRDLERLGSCLDVPSSGNGVSHRLWRPRL